MNLKEARYAFADGHTITQNGVPIKFPMQEACDYQLAAQVGDIAVHKSTGKVYVYTDGALRKELNMGSLPDGGKWWCRKAGARVIRFLGDTRDLIVTRGGKRVPEPRAHKLANVIRAFADGKKVESKTIIGWQELKPTTLSFDECFMADNYRIAVEVPCAVEGDVVVFHDAGKFCGYSVTTAENLHRLHGCEFSESVEPNTLALFRPSESGAVRYTTLEGAMKFPSIYGEPVKIARGGKAIWEKSDD